MIFAIHFEIYAQCRPACAKVRFPLQFNIATCDSQSHFVASLVIKCDCTVCGINLFNWNIKYTTCFRVNGKENGISLPTFFSKAGQHDFHYRIIFIRCSQKRFIKFSRAVKFCCRVKIIFEAKLV